MSAVLLVRLKITDLTAWTALHTGQALLPPGHALTRVAREQLLLFEPEEAAGTGAFEGNLERAITGSNFFVNPNRESHRFLRAGERGDVWSPPAGAWGILARTRDDTRDEGLRGRLELEHPLPGLRAIRRAKVWWLWTQGPAGDPAVHEAYEALGPVRGARQGLLVNPHAEAALLIEGGIAWKDVEAFLTAPAPAHRAAA